MAVLIDTGVVDAADRVDFWTGQSCAAFHPLHIATDGADRFHARMWGDQLGAVRMFRVSASANTMSRTRRDIAAGDDAAVHLQIMLRGRLQGTQQDHTSVMGPGDIMSYDTSQPVEFRAGADFDLFVLKLPKALLGREVSAQLPRLTSAPISGRTGLPRLATRFFCAAAAGLADGSIARDDTDLAEHIIDLVARLYRDLDAPPVIHARSRTDLRQQAKTYIQAHLGDPDLNPAQVARACFVSTRYLHRVFADEGRTVAEWIRRERLEHCRRDLADPALSHRSIAAIATRWGLPCAPHFSRLFHRAYACSPREFRQRIAGGAGGTSDER